MNPQPSDLESDALAVRATGLNLFHHYDPGSSPGSMMSFCLHPAGVRPLTISTPLFPYAWYDVCNAYSISSAESSQWYFFYSSCWNNFCSCTRYTEKVLCLSWSSHSRTSVTTPAPTVLPPSLMANLNSFSIAIGAISSTTTLILSPGITISTPSGKCATPVTSVVLK